MDKRDFKNGIVQLSLFFPKFKPEESQMRAWFDRLEKYSVEAFRLAIFRITETKAKAPSFAELKYRTYRAEAELSSTPDRLPEAQGWAPDSPEKNALTLPLLKELSEAVGNRTYSKELKKQIFSDLERVYTEGFKKLPGYLSKEEIEDLIKKESWEELIRVGFITEKPEKKKPYAPLFEEEKNTPIRARVE